MLRLLSLILLLAGAGVAALGGWLYMGNSLPAGLLGTSEPVVERKVYTVEAPEPSAVMVEPPVAPATAPPPPRAVPVDTMEAMEPAVPMDAEPAPREQPQNEPPKAGKNPQTTTRTRSLSPPAVDESLPGDTEMAARETAPEPEREPVPEPVLEPMPAPEPMRVPEEPVFSATSTSPTAPPPTIEQQLYTVPIAYETPSKAPFGQSFQVVLSINAQEGATTAAEALPGDGNVVETVAEVTDRVEASLLGDAFDIELKTPKRLKLSTRKESLWRWEVTPVKSGPQDLTFDLYAIDINDEAESVLTFNDTVTVEVSYIGQAMFLAQKYDPIVMVIAGFGSLLAGLFGVARFFRGR